ncbi:MAG: hypothetical protein ACLQGP_25730 [Isosphaeraceae bacterium]
MNGPELQFIFDGFADLERSIALGRCGDVPIHLGDVFDAVYRHKRRRYPDEMGDDPVREVEKPAAIQVVGIHAYERCLKTLGQGMTGSLTLEGDGLQYLAPGWILGQKSEVEPTAGQASEAATASV